MSPKSAYQWHQLWRDGGAQAIEHHHPPRPLPRI
ncbi:hypothetical protein ABT116_30270 [Streptomyces sp. NPDC002130]